MNILWITNITLPEANELLGINNSFKETGGWLIGAANSMSSLSDVALSIATVNRNVEKLTTLRGANITYYLIPFGKGYDNYNKEYETYWREINKMTMPDIVHIHGTEYTHGLSYVNACGSQNVVVSIQGMKSAYYNYYLSGLTFGDIISNITLYDLLTGGLLRQKYLFYKTGEYEKKLLLKVNHIIGRTSWDKARTWAINPQATYHFCNETLRKEFYCEKKWNYKTCDKHTIFISQATYPIKGLHQLLKALPLILKQYPNTQVRVAGKDIRFWSGLSGFLHYSCYGKYLKRTIQKLGLENNVIFTGNLNASQMIEEYLRCNLFLCPSSIENSPNSLGEAQILGTPVLASYVGGIPDMMTEDKGNLYRYEEIEMLAYKVCQIFSTGRNTSNMMAIAKERHCPETNSNSLRSIYMEIVKNNN